MVTRRRRGFVVRDDGELVALLDERVKLERENGRTVSREGLVRDILRNWLRHLRMSVPR